jgi:hypothetical protein
VSDHGNNGLQSQAVIQQIDMLLEQDDLSTRTGLRLAFSAMRDAIQFMSTANDRMNEMEKKVEEMWKGYKILTWGAGIIGGAIILLLWAVLTGQAAIHYGPLP